MVPHMDLFDKSYEYLLGQGILGFTTLILGVVAVFLYRENKALRNKRDQDVADERARHAIEIAAERKFNAELQENRLVELRNALTAVTKVTETLDQALAIMHRRTPA